MNAHDTPVIYLTISSDTIDSFCASLPAPTLDTQDTTNAAWRVLVMRALELT